MKAKFTWLLISLSSLFFLTGCWDKHEIEEQAFVIAIGMDKGGPKNNEIKVTYLISNPQVGLPNTGGELEPPKEIVTIPAPDLSTAKDLANATVSRKINFAYTKVIIVSEEMAKSTKFYPFLKSAMRDRQLRRSLDLIVSREKAADFIRNNHPNLETRPHKYYDLMSSRWKETGLVPSANLQQLLFEVQSKMDGFLSVLASTKKENTDKYGLEDSYTAGQIDQKGGNVTEVIGGALFDQEKMVGELTGEEVRLSLMMRPKLIGKNMYTTYPDPLAPGYLVSTRLTHHLETNIEIDTNKTPIQIHVVIPLTMEIVDIPSGINYVTDMNKQRILKDALEKSEADKAARLVKKTQKVFKTDPFDWGEVAETHFLTKQAFEKFNWKEKYLDADVHVKVIVSIKGFGKEIE